jgi:filamentous hemagglutinin
MRGLPEIQWGGGINDQNGKWEQYYGKVNLDARYLGPYAKGFDHFNDETGEAISNKTLNTLTAGYIKNPQAIYRQLTRYVDNAVNYEPRDTELVPTLIKSKTIQLAIPEYTSPMQWRYLLRAIIYGKDNGVSIVITRIRE